MPRRRNVLFITADQWRGDTLGCLGHPAIRTPVLDALAAQGALFMQHRANTTPCSPSRASLHTGLYLHTHRVVSNGTPLDARLPNWATDLRAAGLDPCLVGYTDQTPDPRGLDPDDPRLTTYEGLLPGITPYAEMGMENPRDWARALRATGFPVPQDERLLVWMREGGPDYEDGAPCPKPFAVPGQQNDTAWSIDRAIDFVTERRATDWVLHLSLLRPHPPFIASEPWNRAYDPAAVPGFNRGETPEAESAAHPYLAWLLGQWTQAAPRDERKLRRLKAVYFGLMSEVDHHLGRLFAHLRHEGLWEDTLIILTSDHGEMLGDHWLLGKSAWFEPVFHIPLILRDPRAQGGRRISALSESVDIRPTVLGFFGLTPAQPCHGRDLAPLAASGHAPADWRTVSVAEVDFRDVADPAVEAALGLSQTACSFAVIRSAHDKLVQFAGLPSLYYDLAADPRERHDRAADPLTLPRRHALLEAYAGWRMRHEDETLACMTASPEGLIVRAP